MTPPPGTDPRPGAGDDRPGHPMMASIILVVAVSLLVVLLALLSSI